MSSHTLGPWVVCFEDDGAGVVFATSQLIGGCIPSSDWDDAIAYSGRNHPENEANARLIASAPELLAERDALVEQLAQARADAAELLERMNALMPLFEEARDALTAIPMASAKLHSIRLDLADRMDAVGIPERWAAREALAKAKRASHD